MNSIWSSHWHFLYNSSLSDDTAWLMVRHRQQNSIFPRTSLYTVQNISRWRNRNISRQVCGLLWRSVPLHWYFLHNESSHSAASFVLCSVQLSFLLTAFAFQFSQSSSETGGQFRGGVWDLAPARCLDPEEQGRPRDGGGQRYLLQVRLRPFQPGKLTNEKMSRVPVINYL